MTRLGRMTLAAAAATAIAGLLAVTLPTGKTALAEDRPAAGVEELFAPPPLDMSVFRRYDISFDDTVSTEVLRTETVRKIGFGRVTDVWIATTGSGVYSSDAMVSPNIRYPGITVTPLEEVRTETIATEGGFWLRRSAGSFVYLTYVPGAAERT